MKLVIVEDEEIIRNGLLENVKWRSLGIEVVGQAEDGQEAEELIDRARPDIVVSDIRIPFLDGLTLAEHVTEKYPGTAIVLLSGYDDFDYARRAITIGVEDYILKPIDLDNFSDVLRRVCRKIETLRREKHEVEELRNGADRLKRVLRERLVADLIAERITDDEARQKLPDLFGPGTWFAVLNVEIDAAAGGPASARSAAVVGGADAPTAATGAPADPPKAAAVQRALVETAASLEDRALFLIDEAEGQLSL
ncbi:MAG TPA: response regulator, partial [Spirochaetia bacterium]